MAITWLFPAVCVGCGVLMRDNGWACRACLVQHTPFPPAAADQPLAVASYEGPAERALVRLKFHSVVANAGPLGRLLAAAPQLEQVIGLGPIVPIPLHWRRLARRGFNQTLLIARHAAAERPQLRRALAPELLVRRRNTGAQSSLPAAARTENVAGAFVVPRAKAARVRGRHVIVFDDVVTTGATVAAAAEALLQAGARCVSVLALMRTLA